MLVTMEIEKDRKPGFWGTVLLLLDASHRRAEGRKQRRQEILNKKSGKPAGRRASSWGWIGYVFSVLFLCILNGMAAFTLLLAVDAGQRFEAERQGKIVVSRSFLNQARELSTLPNGVTRTADEAYFPKLCSSEARQNAEHFGENETDAAKKYCDAVQNHETGKFVTEKEATPGMKALAKGGRLPAMLGMLVLIWWTVMLILQGEGLELDLQQRRHPMWEWLFSHPVHPGAIFLAEMLSPIAANPIYWCAPLFVGIVFGFVYGPLLGVTAALLVGIPVTVGAACLGKALEIAVILRFSPRSRGAMIGLMSWLGYASVMMFFLGAFFIPRLITVAGRLLSLFTVVPWPWLPLLLGGQPNGSFSFLYAMAICWAVAMGMITFAVWFSAWGAQQGLSGNFSAANTRPSKSRTGAAQFGRDPLYHKEFLWFIRDRSAIVQAILIPITLASAQMFNLRHLLLHAQDHWNYLCGAGIMFGTYFLWVLGPKSLASEGTALWIALTWPRGMESLLKAKAWLWAMISTGLVALVLGYAAFLFPKEIWKIALVGIAWYFFGRSMAEKSVTLVTVTSASGEAQKIPSGRRWATQLGMMTFAIGILSQQWHIAFMGIVYSYVTAAAMWQNFRARLPYLYDPWSETLPPPPTLMHAMISISILVEGGAVLTGMISVFAGHQYIAIAQAVSYGICALVVSFGVNEFLSNRNVWAEEVWCWSAYVDHEQEQKPWWSAIGFRDTTIYPLLALGAGGGLLLGIFARGYMFVLSHWSITAEIIHKSQEQMAILPGFHIAYAVMAILFAPFAEEYLFRGLLYRSLDREWGGWLAVFGSAAFFAIYHPVLAWVPVALVGASNALLFKKTGRLFPAVILHMVYNIVVVSQM